MGRIPKLTPAQEAKVREYLKEGRSTTELARVYDVSRVTIQRYLPEQRRYRPRVQQRDLTGEVFGKWTVLEKVPRPAHLGTVGAYYRCRCECGAVRVIIGRNLIHGISRQCAQCGGKQSQASRLKRRTNVPRETSEGENA